MSTPQKFHINGKGQAAACSAVMRPCPLGGEHYDTKQAAAQAIMEAELGIASPSIATAVVPETTDSWTHGEIRVRELPTGYKVGPDKAVLPPGRYFLGDPCYTAGSDDDAWQQWVEVAYEKGDSVMGASYNGYPIIAANTAYGDGCYWADNGEEYTVDAGLIGVVPEAVIQGMGLAPAELGVYGSWVKVDHSASLEYDAEAESITFGSVTIYTGDEEEEEEVFYCSLCDAELDNSWDSWCEVCAEEEFATG